MFPTFLLRRSCHQLTEECLFEAQICAKVQLRIFASGLCVRCRRHGDGGLHASSGAGAAAAAQRGGSILAAKRKDLRATGRLALGRRLDCGGGPPSLGTRRQVIQAAAVEREEEGAADGCGYFKNGAALLELALVQWAAHEAVKRGFQPFIPPDLVRARGPSGFG
eukprot:Skav203105  [mRNA]  locus=scaffold447:322591:331653:+ [translate_table: standard]